MVRRAAVILAAAVGTATIGVVAALALNQQRTTQKAPAKPAVQKPAAPVPSKSGTAPAPAAARPGAPRPATDAGRPRPAVAPLAAAADWPQWRGPQRTGISRETGLLKTWPVEGPALVWKAVGLGGGYSTPSVAAGKVFGMGFVNEEEVVWALDAKTGSPVWSTTIVPAYRGVGYGEGPRCTPTTDGDRLYAIGIGGDLVCLDTATGKLRWRKNLVSDFGGAVPHWGYAESPLVDGEKLIVTPGGGAATIVALNKMNGDVIWRAQVPVGNGAHYASAIAADVRGVRQYIQFLGGGLVGVAAADGRYLWQYARHAGLTANIDTPIYRDNHVLISAGYNSGAGLVKLEPAADGTWTATEVYFNPDLKSKHGGMVLIGNQVYAFDDPGTLTCMDFMTGQVLWRDRSVGGNASITAADGHLYCRSARGTVALVAATPDGYVEKSRFEQPERSTMNAWAHPVVANGRLYLRDQDILLCYAVK